MTIKIFASITDTEPRETYERDGVTVSDFFREFYPDFKDADKQPFACFINGELIECADWHKTELKSSDDVEIRLLPKGKVEDYIEDGLGYAFPIHYVTHWAIGKGTQELIKWAVDMPDTPSSKNAGARGNQISVADAKANLARAGEIIPEGFGRYLRYPDYLNQPRKYFKDTKTQCIDLLLCVGYGTYSPEFESLSIGETPLSRLVSNYRYFDPGVSVTSHQAYRNWFNVQEVGGTQISQGIKIPYSPERTSGIYGIGAGFNGSTITALLPNNWVVDDVISIDFLTNVMVAPSAISALYNAIGGNGTFSSREMPSGILCIGKFVGYPEFSGEFLNTVSGSLIIRRTISSPSDGDIAATPESSFNVMLSAKRYQYKITGVTKSGGNTVSVTVQRLIDGVVDSAWPGFASVPNITCNFEIYPNAANQQWAGPYVITPPNESTTICEFDILCPNGLGYVDDDGNMQSLTRNITFQYRKLFTNAWTTVTKTIIGSTRDQQGYTFRESLGSSGLYEVRFKRNQQENNKSNYFDKIELIGLKSELATKTSYPGASVLAVTIEGVESLASATQNQINLVATRMLPISETDPTLVRTRSIKNALLHILKSIGYTNSEIDITRLNALSSIWSSRGETFDYFFTETTVKEAIDSVLAIGSSALTVDFGILRPVRDGVRTTFEQVYSPENMTSVLSRSFKAKLPDDFTGVQVEYTDSNTWTVETVNCFLPGDSTVKLDKMTIVGACTRTQAWRLGMRRRRSHIYRPWGYEFETEMDALNSSYLSYISLVDDVPGYGKAALMREVYSDRIVLSEPVEFQAGKSHVIAYRDLEGNLKGPYAATQGPDVYTVMCSIPAPLPVNYNDREQIHVYFGTTETWTFPALVTEISQSGDGFRVSAINYDARVYADDNNTPPV